MSAVIRYPPRFAFHTVSAHSSDSTDAPIQNSAM
jgi:hypothetical protein